MTFFLAMLAVNAILLSWLGVEDPWMVFLICLATPLLVGVVL